MHAFDQSQAGAYHVAQLRAEARREAMSRALAPRPHLRDLVRQALRHH